MAETFTQDRVPSGVLSRDGPGLIGRLSPVESLIGLLSIPQDAKIETYEGAYVVDPDTRLETILETKRKFLIDDITVHRVQYSETTNPSGGCTVFIG